MEEPLPQSVVARLPASHEGMVLWAMIALMTQRLAQAR